MFLLDLHRRLDLPKYQLACKRAILIQLATSNRQHGLLVLLFVAGETIEFVAVTHLHLFDYSSA